MNRRLGPFVLLGPYMSLLSENVRGKEQEQWNKLERCRPPRDNKSHARLVHARLHACSGIAAARMSVRY
jgi:hypothetical protein